MYFNKIRKSVNNRINCDRLLIKCHYIILNSNGFFHFASISTSKTHIKRTINSLVYIHILLRLNHVDLFVFVLRGRALKRGKYTFLSDNTMQR